MFNLELGSNAFPALLSCINPSATNIQATVIVAIRVVMGSKLPNEDFDEIK